MSQPTIRSVIPHLVVDGAAKALEFYAQAFGAVPGSVMPIPDGDRIIHADMTIGGQAIYLVDEFPENQETGGVMIAPPRAKGTTVAIALNVDDADAVFAQAVKAGATAHMPVENTFWGARYGQLLDPYGHMWEVNQEVQQRSEDEMKAAWAADMENAGR
jgi:PhnB protein